jgi:TolB protein
VSQFSRKAWAGVAAVVLAGGAAATAAASFPGRNGKIVFASTRTGSNQLWTMDARGRKPVRVTRGNAGDDSSPSVSRDGRSIVFERLSRRSHSREINVVAISGGKVRRLTRNSVDDAAPSWSPDSKRIVFRSDRDGDPEIYVMRWNGGGSSS